MPLHVYMYAKPPDKVVRINDAYFLANTKLEDTEQCRRILRIIDQAEYCSEKTFIGRDKSLGALFTDNLVQELRHYLIYRSTETYVSIQSNVATMLSLSSWDLQKVKPFYIRE